MYQHQLSWRPTDRKHNQLSHPMYQRQLSLRPTDRPKTQSVMTHPMYQRQLSLRPTNRPKTQSVITHPAYQRQLSLRPTDRPKTQNYLETNRRTKNTISNHTSRVSVSTILKTNRQTKHSYCISINSSKGQGRESETKSFIFYRRASSHGFMAEWTASRSSFIGGCPDLMGLYMPWPDEVGHALTWWGCTDTCPDGTLRLRNTRQPGLTVWSGWHDSLIWWCCRDVLGKLQPVQFIWATQLRAWTGNDKPKNWDMYTAEGTLIYAWTVHHHWVLKM